MPELSVDHRKALDKSVVTARDRAEEASRAALNALGVEAREAPSGISDDRRALRNALRAKQRQLADDFELLVAECAYEQWHLMLFARFLAENELLIHPVYGTHVSLAEVAELARASGESDAWLLAARYAEAMLPGIFKPADPCVRLPLAPDGRRALEDILTALPSEVFTADDALGWVYQFWQTKKKKEVNASERKIGGADLAPVTQLFTEHYMVRFLLENSLGAWWAARHPGSPLLAEWEYLRYSDDGEPAAGRFEGWPETVAEVTIMDPCCGSGHFLVSAFEMLRRMREEEEELSTREAVDAVLTDNLYGLELDARCVQLGAFNLALAAWRASGYHELPSLNLACSGIPTRSSLEEWTVLAGGDERLELALTRLHELFREADTLGSLIDPRRAVEDDTLMSVSFAEVAPLLERALSSDPDPVAAVFGEGAREVAKAATLLAGSYTLVATNVPYLARGKQGDSLRAYCDRFHPAEKGDLAVAVERRAIELAAGGGSVAFVAPDKQLFLGAYRRFREDLIASTAWNALGLLGPQAFSTPMFDLGVILFVLTTRLPVSNNATCGLDAAAAEGPSAKAETLRSGEMAAVLQLGLARNPDSRFSFDPSSGGRLLSTVADSRYGLRTGDSSRLIRCVWEVPVLSFEWRRHLGSPSAAEPYSGREHVLLWQEGRGVLAELAKVGIASIQGEDAWGRQGVLVRLTGDLLACLYTGESYDNNVAVVWPHEISALPALWAFCRSCEHSRAVREIDRSLKITNQTLLKVPFDLAHWQKVAEEQYPDGLPEPHSDDPTQWLFKGNVVGSEQPLHVALARLLGYRWPDQEPDELDALADEDGIVCLPPVMGERPADERVRELLAAAYGDAFSPQTVDELLAAEGSKNLGDWLRDKAFASHAKLFQNRPFIWHLWDGRKDGFSALVNYHRLDHQTLQKLTYTYLGWWIERQRGDAAAEVAGAEARLVAAIALQDKLKLILEGEPPCDIYVRWKPIAEQPFGWQPDLNDGVRLNIRPFVTAGVLRTRLSIHWNKDRGKNPDGSERLNDLHITLAEKRAAREEGQGE